MRKLFFFFIIIISCFQIQAQDSSKIQKQIDSLQKRLEINAKDDFELLTMNGTAYTLLKNKIEEQGLVHFLPYSKITGIHFYKLEKDILIQITRGIYKQEKDQLVICYNVTSDKRPEDFLSTAENQFVLAYYNTTV